MRHFAAGLAVLTSILLTGCIEISDTARYHASFHYSYDLAPGGRLTIENYNGEVEVTGWDGDKVDISGSKYASSQTLLDRVQIEVHNDPQSMDIRTIRPNEFLSGAGAQYKIRVPRSAVVDQITSTNGSIHVSGIDSGAHLRSSNGSIRAENLKGRVEVETSNGTISLAGISGGVSMRTSNGRIRAENIQGECRARTSNGSIDLAFVRAPGEGIRAETSNGGITVRLPPDTSARLDAHTSNGNISSDVNVSGQVRADRNHLTGNIGAGGPLIELTTRNASIHVLGS